LIFISGSTTVYPICVVASQEFMDVHRHIEIEITSEGSTVGIRDAGLGISDIGMASRDMKDEEKEKYPDLITTRIGSDGLSIVVHNDNPVTGLTMDQLKKIYLGEITKWSEVGGPNMDIILVGRDANSGTRGAFDELVLDDASPAESMQKLASNSLVHSEVQDSKYAIGYIGLGFVDDDVTPLKIDNTEASVETVQSGTYPISRPLNIVTNGEPEGKTKEFIDFLLSDDGQDIVAAQDFVPLV
jgi:phosphate transport system substrate-binding protein